MTPPPPRLPQSRDPLGLEELRRAYNVHHSTPPQDLVDTLLAHFQGIHPDWRFAVTFLPRGATNICV